MDAVDDAVDVGMGAVMAVSEMRSRAQQRLSWKVLRNLRLPLLAPQNREERSSLGHPRDISQSSSRESRFPSIVG